MSATRGAGLLMTATSVAVIGALVPWVVATVADGSSPPPGTLVVNAIEDGQDETPGDGRCETFDPGECTLRAALEEANANPVIDRITFSIDEPLEDGAQIIEPNSALPMIETTLEIDATTEPDYAGQPIVMLDGGMTSGANGLNLGPNGDDSTIRGFIINNFELAGIKVEWGNVGSTIAGNWIGAIDAKGDGTSDVNVGPGVEVDGTNTVVGGPVPADRNVISGNDGGGVTVVGAGADGNRIENNVIGIRPDETATLPNGGDAIALLLSADDTVIVDNLIAHPNGTGVLVDADSTGTRVQGNTFGTDRSGTAVWSGLAGAVGANTGSFDTLVGGDAFGDGNVIAHAGTDPARQHAVGVRTGASAVVLGNSIRASGDIGIDLEPWGSTANDVGDADGGANDLLNHPVITNATEARGTTTITFDLDAPANPDGYSVEFFANPSGPNGSGNDEGETFVGSTIVQPGTGHELTVSGSDGDRLTASATRVDTTAVWGYAATSEFSPGFVVASRSVTVNSTSDHADATPGDGACDVGIGDLDGAPRCTLRAAIEETNASAQLDVIEFGIPASDLRQSAGVWTIDPASPLPSIASTVTLDATTQPGWAGAPVVELEGLSLWPGSDPAIKIEGAGSEVRGLAVNLFPDVGLEVAAPDVVVAGNYIGLAPDGITDRGNNGEGILTSAAGDRMLVGGADPADRNVVANNRDSAIGVVGSDDVEILGNYIGVQADGVTAAGNGEGILAAVADRLRIGGDAAGEGNVIANGTGPGINLTTLADNAVIQGNHIGVGADGTTPAPNGYSGIQINDTSTGHQIGGRDPGQANIIAHNTTAGFWDNGTGTPAAVVGNQIWSNDGPGIDHGGDGPSSNDPGDVDAIPNAPVIVGATHDGASTSIDVELDGQAGDYVIDVYSNPGSADASGYGEGEVHLGSFAVAHAGSGSEAFTGNIPGVGVDVTATATHVGPPEHSTSEFSNSMAVASSVMTVNSTGDQPDAAAGDGECATGGTNSDGDPECTFRAALEAVSTVGGGSIEFDLPKSDPAFASDVWTIRPASALPPIDVDVVLDATTQPTWSATPVVELDGSLLAGTGDGLTVTAADVTVRGLAVGRFPEAGIRSSGANGVFRANHLGVGPDGVTDIGNGGSGIVVDGGDGTSVGGTDPSHRNVIGFNDQAGVAVDNADAVTVAGNLVGVRIDGTSAAGNHTGIRADGATNLVVGGSAPNGGNVIGANTYEGIELHDSPGAIVRGNRIGIGTDGIAALGNEVGIEVNTSAGVVIGGIGTGDANVIGNGTWEGIWARSGDGLTVQGNLIGVAPDGVTPAPNGWVGVRVDPGLESAMIGGRASGAGNTIAHSGSGQAGVWAGASAAPPAIVGNSIHSNSGDGIFQLAVPPPTLLGARTRGSATTVEAIVDRFAGSYTIDYYTNPSAASRADAEGEVHVASMTFVSDGSGPTRIRHAIPVGGGIITATLTDLDSPEIATSPFSNAVAASSGSSGLVTDLSPRRSDLWSTDGVTSGGGIVDDGIAIPSGADQLVGPALDVTDDELTLSGWIRVTSTGGRQLVMSKRDSDGNPIYELGVDATAEAVASLRLSGAAVEARGGTVAAGTWHHLTAVWDGAELVLYVDGVEVDRVAATGMLDTDPTTRLAVGNRSDGEGSQRGADIDHVSVAHLSVAADRVSAHHEMVRAGASFVSVGAQQTAPAGAWAATTDVSRSGTHSLAAPTTPGSPAWAVARGIDEPGVVFESWWWLTSEKGIDVAAGTRTGEVVAEQYEVARDSSPAQRWELRQRTGSGVSADAMAAGPTATGRWVRVELWTDQLGRSRLLVDGVEVIGWTAQGATLPSGSIGLLVEELPGGVHWYVDDAQARKLVTPEPTTSLGPLVRD